MSLFRKRRDRDPVADQLRTLARQGSGMAKVAHLFAFLLIILFSLASLVALGAEALAHVQASWQTGHVDIPSAISLGVIVLLVPCMDIAMLIAAATLRLLEMRQARTRDKIVHGVVLCGVALVESATYVYMAWEYERPATWEAWALIIARALAAPLVGIYLSMARPLPVTPRDILYQAELTSGAGMLRDVAMAANDSGAALDQKMALYSAAAIMPEADRWRLESMIAVVSQQQRLTGQPSATLSAMPAPRTPEKPPTGPGTPSSRHPVFEATDQTPSVVSGSLTELATSHRKGSRRISPIRIRAKAADVALDDRRRAFVDEQLTRDPELSPNALANAIEAAGMGKCGWHTAARYKANWQRRHASRMLAAQ